MRLLFISLFWMCLAGCGLACKARFAGDPGSFLHPAANRAHFGSLQPWTVETAIPVTLVIDRQGAIIYRKVGPVDQEFEQVVLSALGQKP